MKVVITGSSSGIGQAIAKEFLLNGHQVIGIDIEKSTINEPNYQHFQVDIYQGNLPAVAGADMGNISCNLPGWV